MTATMRAIEISAPGGPEVLTPDHAPGARAHGRADPHRGRPCRREPPRRAAARRKLRAAARRLRPAGAGGRGRRGQVGPGVTRWKEGDEVTALLPGGGYAEYALTHQDHALPVPEGMGMAEAAALCETFFTVWTNVFMRGGLRAGNGSSSMAGRRASAPRRSSLARHFGARVFATAGSDEKCAACVELGAERAINYREEDFVEILRAEGGANLILDMVGGSYLPRNVKALADDGRLVQIAFLQGPKVELNFAQVMMRRLTITGSTLRPQSDAAKADIAEALRESMSGRCWTPGGSPR
jgi:NADPH2:quinone reductase